MTKFELARTAGRWRPRSRTYVALAILFVTACSTNAKDLTLPRCLIPAAHPPARSGTARKRFAPTHAYESLILHSRQVAELIGLLVRHSVTCYSPRRVWSCPPALSMS